MNSSDRQLFVLNFSSSDFVRIENLGMIRNQSPVLTIATGIASSEMWDQIPGSEIIVRISPPAIAFIGKFGFPDEVRLKELAGQVRHALNTLLYISYAHAEDDCRVLAFHLMERFSREELKRFHFTAIPRGGLIVLGMLSYILELERWQLEAPHSDREPLVIVDDCSLSGCRFRKFIDLFPDKKIIFTHLYSHPLLRSSIEAKEPQVLACISAHDIVDFLQDATENENKYREQIQNRLAGPRYWLGIPEYLCFAWNEPNRLFYNPATEKIESGWSILPSSICLKTKKSSIPVHVQPECKGQFRTPNHLIFADYENYILIGNQESKDIYILDGTAAKMWKGIMKYHNLENIIDELYYEYDVEKGSLKNDLTRFIENLVCQGILERVDENFPL